ncbi:9822_t:CDS:1, partial [Gigaspora rosea]
MSFQEGTPERFLSPLSLLTNDNIPLITRGFASSEYNEFAETSKLSQKKRRTSNSTIVPTSSNTSAPTKPLRANASYTQFCFENNEAGNTIRYCKLCIKKLEGSQLRPYPYNKSGGSTGNLTQHLRDKHKITSKNYLYYLDSQNQ